MSKHMLIDASHPEETRVVVVDGSQVEEFDFEAATKRPLKGNIYLAKVTRVEPSLQAAFVEYGGNRQGFLAFSEIHPDYYQIPVADRMAILKAQTERLMAEDDVEAIDSRHPDNSEPAGDDAETYEHAGSAAQEFGETGENHDQTSQEGKPGDRRQDLRAGADFDRGMSAGVAASSSDEPDAEASEPPPDRETDDSVIPNATRLEGEAPETAIGADAAEHRASGGHSHPDTPPQDTATAIVQAEITGAPIAYQRRESSRHERPRPRRRQYKIQEVIKRRQVMLVQVVKEERGNKGASLTTFLSLAGRYCVLMPNTPRGGGISRKITNLADRKRLKSAAQSLDLPEGMGLIIRTAGANRTKTEIKRDYEYLLRLWDTVRELTLKSNAPALVYEEGSLIKRAIRDLYSKEISEIIVDGETGYREAKEFMRMLMPSHAKNVKLYREPLPLFQRLQVESQLDAMFSPVVHLKSGGYIVINQTEALVSIDVNSGRATREHSIEETAAKTNLEAADEVARQLRLRDLAGLIVIDFIDMEDSKNDRNVEKRLHNAVRNDRARIQIGRISQFGLLELSRQRLRAGVVAGSTITCPHCNGQGIIRSTESAALRLLRALDEEGQHQPSVNLTVRTPLEVAIYTLNQKRRELARIEEAYDLGILFEPHANMVSGSFEILRTGMRVPVARPKLAAISVEGGFDEPEPAEPESDITIVEPPETVIAAAPPLDNEGAGTDAKGPKRRRRRRGGRGRTGRPGETEAHLPEKLDEADVEPAIVIAKVETEDTFESGTAEENGPAAPADPQQQSAATEAGERKRRRRRRGRRGRRFESDASATPDITEDSGLKAGLGLTEISETEAASLGVAPPEHATLFESPSQSGQVADVLPNMPSSPVWSLLDQQGENELPVSRPKTAPEPVSAESEGETASVSLESVSGTMGQPVEETSEEQIATGTPREIRKGWWQRRFKA